MNKPILLLIVLAALVGVAVVSKNQKSARLNEIASRGVKSREFLLPDLPVNNIAKITIKNQDSEVSLIKGETDWTVEQRSGYPADIAKLQRVLPELKNLKISTKHLVGESAFADSNLLEPAEGLTSGSGTQILLLDDKAGQLANVIVGDDIEASGGNQPQFGAPPSKLVRLPLDQNSVWTISSGLGEWQPRPEDWVEKAFLVVEKMKSLKVTPADKSPEWFVARADENATDYILQSNDPKEGLDTGKLSLASLLSTPGFNDVQSRADAGDLMKDAAKAQIATFDDFTYDLQVVKLEKEGASKFYMTVDVSAKLPKERKKGKDEKEEDAEQLDAEFQSNLARLSEKLENEKKLSNWVYEVAEYTVNNLLLTRADITTEIKEEEAPEGTEPAEGTEAGSAAGAIPMAPPPVQAAPETSAAPVSAPAIELKEPASVTTEPIQAPAPPKVELKPAPAPEAPKKDADEPVPADPSEQE